MHSKWLIWVAVFATTTAVLAQEAPPAPPTPKPCLVVVEAGSHAFRNIMLGGIAGAIVSKKQYQVVKLVHYPSHIGQKFHGSDLQMFAGNGTEVIILDKKYGPEELAAACAPGK